MRDRIIIGTRGSELALWQAHFVRNQLHRISSAQIEIVIIKTTGDRQAEVPWGQLPKGIFIKEIEDALLEGEIDIAVHSMKDVTTDLPAGLRIGAICARDDVHDALIAKNGSTFTALPSGSTVGTSSLRRKAQLRARRSDVEYLDIRGNVDTRLRKLQEGHFDAIVLAKSGLDRLGWSNQISEVLPTSVVLPAVGQGALGIEARSDDQELIDLLRPLSHPSTEASVMAERSLLRELHGGCQVPIGAWGRVEEGSLVLEANVVSPDGSRVIRDVISGPLEQSTTLGAELARRLVSRGADHILAEVNAYREETGAGRNDILSA